MNSPKFSVIMPTYNRSFCICNAIDSLLAQTYPAFELLIIDDGSTDNTESIIKDKYSKQFNRNIIKYIRLEHVGVCKARNIGLSNCSRDWICYLDTDNILLPHYLGILAYNILHNNNKAFYCKCQTSTKQIIGKPFNLSELIQHNFIDLGTYSHHKSLSNTLGGFNETMTRLVDWELIIRYSKLYTPLYINNVVLQYNNSKNIQRISNNESYEANLNILRKIHPII